jgi:hypothetical protein
VITRLTGFTAIALVQVATANGNAEVQLRWKLSEGTHLRVSLTQSIKSETSVGERTEAISFESQMEMDWRADRTDDDGSIHLTQTYKRFRLKSAPPDAEPAVYDSSAADEPPDQMKPIARAMRPLIGIRTSLVLSHRGEILEAVQPPETKSLLGDLPSTSQWRQMLTTEGMERVLQQSLGILPESPVEVGDSWTHTREVQSPLGPLRIENRFTYDGTVPSDGRILQRIRGSTTTRFIERDTAGQPSQTLRHPPQPALYLFDNEAGYLVESHVTQAVGSEVPYGDTTVRVKTSGTVTLKIVRRER